MTLSPEQFQQLPMFMTAQELHDTHSIDVQQTPESRFGGAYRSMPEMWRTKRRENKQSGLDKDVAANGVHQPVELTFGKDISGEVVYNGHHRVQAAFDADPQQLLPVEHGNLHGFWRT